MLRARAEPSRDLSDQVRRLVAPSRRTEIFAARPDIAVRLQESLDLGDDSRPAPKASSGVEIARATACDPAGLIPAPRALRELVEFALELLQRDRAARSQRERVRLASAGELDVCGHELVHEDVR